MVPAIYLYNPTFYNIFFITAAISIPKYTEAIGIPLILLLSLKVMLQGSKLWSRSFATFLDMAIYPLLLSYGIIVFFKVTSIVAQNLHN